ncbi:uncharacterized protein L3040_006410 [Drepanopeziza brunnea f. sp. 'multigermtubi']|uniref:uncharacterized protein n=1 Tax=Drepanopeziza brunnea f. sp. 'multigermtubi' TaxID=698441 RepID=UPI002391DAD8|nr:hypothetical protein L3040_006410 [Drepanopeziza brunnea f. sp. 'multigermtubi']
MEAVLMSELRKLKHEARIPVPRGWHLHGIMDETGSLKEGEIFCVGVEEGVKNVITSERLVITRAPALDPGDVRIAKAVMPPAESPLMELGGGDLDGDRFYVIWDDDALPENEFEAAEYPSLPRWILAALFNAKISLDSALIIKRTSGSVPSQLVTASQQIICRGGTDAEKCKTFAMLHGVAVDFPKTGIPACCMEETGPKRLWLGPWLAFVSVWKIVLLLTQSAEEQLVSFKYLAASLCLREVDKISEAHDGL